MATKAKPSEFQHLDRDALIALCCALSDANHALRNEIFYWRSVAPQYGVPVPAKFRLDLSRGEQAQGHETGERRAGPDQGVYREECAGG